MKMIAGDIRHFKTESGLFPAVVAKGLEYIAANDIALLPAGRIEIEGDRMFVLVQDYTTVPAEQKRPEAHDRFIDIQYIASGEEEIGWCVRRENLSIAEDLRRDKDVIFYRDLNEETGLVLSAGMYAVFFPGDVHRPGCVHGKPQAVRKAVIKISMDLL